MKRFLSVCAVLCGIISAEAAVIWSEGFEGAFPPPNWTTNSVDQNTTYAFNGACSARLNATADYLITPPITNAQTLIFWSYTTSSDPAIVVEYSASQTGPWIEAAESPFSGYTEQWNGQWIAVPSTGLVYFRFRKTGTGTLYLDDLSVEGGTTLSNLPPVLDAIGNKTVFEMAALSFTVTADDPVDHDPVTLNAVNLPTGATFSTNGLFTWRHAAPAGIFPVTFIATDKDGSTNETIHITVIDRPKLLISEIADPSGTGGGDCRFVELYNAGSNTIDLASGNWFLSQQANGGTTWYDIPLTGTVAAASTWVIAYSAPDFSAAYGKNPDQEDLRLNGTGNDAYFLFYSGNHTHGTLIDLYGEMDVNGTDSAWDYTDSRAARNDRVLQPNPTWTAAEWTITDGAETGDMTPGAHGPRPVFQGLENPFVFLGGNLSLAVTAVNTVRTDVITLSATALPVGASFSTAVGTHTVSSTLNWNSPTAGVYTASFAATGTAGANTTSITITVSDRARIAGNFYGWSGDTIFKLDTGQFWQQSVAAAKTVSPALYRPYMTITPVFGSTRMIVTNVTGYVVVSRQDVTESTVTNTFSGLHYQTVFRLADKTVWKQISFETVSSSASPVTVWRWTKNGRQMLRFLDRNNMVVGTCTAEAVALPADTKTHSTVAGNFYGFGYGIVFHLADGSWWKQISFERSDSVRSNPAVLVWNEGESDFLEMPDEAQRVTVKKLNVQLESTVTNTFTGLHYGNLYRFANGEARLQLSFENVSTNVIRPNIMLWTDGTKPNLLVRDSRDVTIGICTVADPNADSDSDGLSNAAEVLAGADPLDSESRFELRQTGRNVLSWDAVEGRIYTVEWSPSLTEIFRPLENYIIWPQNSWTDTVHAAETKGYYRITVRLAD